jgi:hypothetical protein
MPAEERGLRAEEPPAAFSAPAAPAPPPPVVTPELKRCVMCRESIPLAALRCPRCRSLVGLWEGTLHREFFWFLFASFLALLGSCLPWYPDNFALKGYHFLSGAVCLFFAAIAIGTMLYGIVTQRIRWPLFYSIVAWGTVCTLRVSREWSQVVAGWHLDGGWGVYKVFGIGFWFVAPATAYFVVYVLGSIVVSLVKGKKRAPGGRGRGARR